MQLQLIILCMQIDITDRYFTHYQKQKFYFLVSVGQVKFFALAIIK